MTNRTTASGSIYPLTVEEKNRHTGEFIKNIEIFSEKDFLRLFDCVDDTFNSEKNPIEGECINVSDILNKLNRVFDDYRYDTV